MAGKNQLKHGARAAAHAYKTNRLDRRTTWVKEFLGDRVEMLTARGLTEATCDVDRRSLIDRIAFKRVQMRMHERSAMKEMRRGDTPVELPANFFKLSETLRRDELALATLDRAKVRARQQAHDWTQAQDEDDEAHGDTPTH